jgi:hypothetical protein
MPVALIRHRAKILSSVASPHLKTAMDFHMLMPTSSLCLKPQRLSVL